MRNLTALVLLLLCSLYLVCAGSKAANQARPICCPRTVRFRIPLRYITSYYKTRSSCPVKAVVFEMKSGRRVCVDPNAPWVNHDMKKVDLRLNEFNTAETSMAATTSIGAEPPNRAEAFHGAHGSKAENQASQICCPRTVRFKIPLKDITSYYKTSSSCPVKAVVFKMKDGNSSCVDPNAPWVNGHMEKVDLISKKSRRAETTTAARTSTTAEPPNTPEAFHGAQPTTEKPIITEQSTSSVTATVHPGTSAIVGAGQIGCEATVSFRIPLNDITSYYKTSINYPVKAVFGIKNGKIICAPEEPSITTEPSSTAEQSITPGPPTKAEPSTTPGPSGTSAIGGVGQIGCEATLSFRIPLNDITSYYKTSSNYPVKAVFEIKNGKIICAPEEPSATTEPSSTAEQSTTPGPSTKAEPSITQAPLPTEKPSAAAKTSTGSEPPNRPETFHGAQPTTEKLSARTELSITTESSTTAERLTTEELPTKQEPSSTTEQSTAEPLPTVVPTTTELSAKQEPSTKEEPSSTTELSMAEPTATTEPPAEQEPSSTAIQSTAEPTTTAGQSTRKEPSSTTEQSTTPVIVSVHPGVHVFVCVFVILCVVVFVCVCVCVCVYSPVPRVDLRSHHGEVWKHGNVPLNSISGFIKRIKKNTRKESRLILRD